MSNLAKPLLIAAVVASLSALQPLRAETYTIKKLNTPSIRINNKELKVGDKFSDGAVVHWSSRSQAMRVLDTKQTLITLSAHKNSKAGLIKSIIADNVPLSTRAICTSLADHKQAFGGNTHELLDTITVSSIWKQDENNYFEMSVATATGKRIVRLPYTENGEAIINRSMFPMVSDDSEQEIIAEISYLNGRKGETRLITPEMHIIVLPAITETAPESISEE